MYYNLKDERNKQQQPTLRFHFTPVSVAKINKKKLQQMLGSGIWGEENSHSFFVGFQTRLAFLKNSVEYLQEAKNKSWRKGTFICRCFDYKNSPVILKISVENPQKAKSESTI